LLQASDEIGPFTNWNVHDVCGPPSQDATFANFLCGATVINGATSPTAWACSSSSSSSSVMTPERAYDLFFNENKPKNFNKQKSNQQRSKLSNKLFNMDLLSLMKAEIRNVASSSSSSGNDDDSGEGFVLSNIIGETFTCNAKDALATYLSNPEVMEALHVEASNMTSWPGEGIQYNRSATDLLVSPGYPDLIQAGRVLIFR
jgi:hypothetical protein